MLSCTPVGPLCLCGCPGYGWLVGCCGECQAANRVTKRSIGNESRWETGSAGPDCRMLCGCQGTVEYRRSIRGNLPLRLSGGRCLVLNQGHLHSALPRDGLENWIRVQPGKLFLHPFSNQTWFAGKFFQKFDGFQLGTSLN